LIFPHHENEIAQSEALTGKKFANYWIHNGLITVNGQKMSKSIGNTITIRETLNLYNPEVIKYAMLEKHYSTELDINDKVFAVAEKHLYYFYTILNKIDIMLTNTEYTSGNTQDEIINRIEENFIKAMDDDFNTAAAIAELFPISKYSNSIIEDKKVPKEEKVKLLYKVKSDLVRLYSILGLLQENPKIFIGNLKAKHLKKQGIEEKDIEDIINLRNVAKKDKQYELADELRKKLDNKGITLSDTREGTEWDIKELYNVD
jgi:cysteinyl-tRNA synthetase